MAELEDDAPFSSGECSVNSEDESDGAAVFAADGQPYLLVDSDTCAEGKLEALERAEHVANLLNAAFWR
jgi:hypothetical protein